MKSIFYAISSILLLFSSLVLISWADTNGIWLRAEDIRPGAFGSDENTGNSFIFRDDVYFNNRILTDNPSYNLNIKSVSNLNELNLNKLNSQEIITDNFSANKVDTNELCIDDICYSSWTDSLVHRIEFNRNKINLKSDSTYEYPYITFREAMNRFSLVNAYTTEWFELAYSYHQPYTQIPTAFFLETGSNSAPRNLYTTTNPNGKLKSSDSFSFCAYYEFGQRLSYDFNFCKSKSSSVYYFRDSSKPGGRVFMEFSLKPGVASSGCDNVDYLPLLRVGSWGSPHIINPNLGPYVTPLKSQCFGGNIHSRIMGRFVVVDERHGGSKSTLWDHYNDGQDYVYTFKTLSLNYLSQ